MIAALQDLRRATEAGGNANGGKMARLCPARRRGHAETSRRRRGGGTRYRRRGADGQERCDGARRRSWPDWRSGCARRVPCRTGPEPWICRNGAGVPPARKALNRRRRRAFYSVAPWRNPGAVVPGDGGGSRSRSDTCGTRNVRAVGVRAFRMAGSLSAVMAGLGPPGTARPQAGAQRRSRKTA